MISNDERWFKRTGNHKKKRSTTKKHGGTILNSHSEIISIYYLAFLYRRWRFLICHFVDVRCAEMNNTDQCKISIMHSLNLYHLHTNSHYNVGHFVLFYKQPTTKNQKPKTNNIYNCLTIAFFRFNNKTNLNKRRWTMKFIFCSIFYSIRLFYYKTLLDWIKRPGKKFFD